MVFLDTNILLEIILKDRPKRQKIENFLKAINDSTAISLPSVHLIMHFGRKAQISDEHLHGVIGENELLALTAEDYAWAVMNEMRNDFEDVLQLAVAIRLGCDTFVTLDNKLAKAYADAPINIVAL